jgi:hypothetical protein
VRLVVLLSGFGAGWVLTEPPQPAQQHRVRRELVVLDGSSSPSIDVTAAGMLTQLRADVRRLGGELVLSDNIGQVRDVLGHRRGERRATRVRHPRRGTRQHLPGRCRRSGAITGNG